MNVVREITLKYGKKRKVFQPIQSPENVFSFFKYLGKETQENFCCLYLNNKNIPLGFATISKGTISETLIHPREVFSPAIQLLASSVIVVHNHPSGDTTPSNDDLLVTQKLVESGKILSIPVLDHVIIGEKSFLSLNQEKRI